MNLMDLSGSSRLTGDWKVTIRSVGKDALGTVWESVSAINFDGSGKEWRRARRTEQVKYRGLKN